MLHDANKLWIGGNPTGKFKGKDKDTAKFNRVAKIQKVYPEIDSKLRKFCEINSITERKACAFSVLMMIECGIRVGNEDSAEGYISKAKKTEGQTLKTYGLTTLLKEHIRFEYGPAPEGDEYQYPVKMILDFVGKKSVAHLIEIVDPQLIKIGYLFWMSSKERWLHLADDSEITDKMVNTFIKKSIGEGFSAKDFRAFRANIEAARLIKTALQNTLPDLTKKTVNEEIQQIVTEVSKVLGNSPGIARKSYINPQILRKHWNNRGFEVEIKTKKGKIKEIIYPKKDVGE